MDPLERSKSHFLKRAPLDLLQHFYLYLDGISIGRLLLSGDKYIQNSLGNGSAILDFRMTHVKVGYYPQPVAQLPSSSLLAKLARLRRLSINCSVNIQQSSIRAFTPVNLSPTLIEISFSFSWAEWIWRTSSHYRNPSFVLRADMTQIEKASEKEYDLAHMLPSLERLELDGRPALSNAFLVNLPSRLLTLSLVQNVTITEAGLKYLPPDLHELRLPALQPLLQTELLNLPPRILILQLKRLDSHSYHLLPKSLTDLTMKETVIEDHRHLAGLPPDLSSLRTEFIVKVVTSWVHRLPSSLTWLESQIRDCQPGDIALADLPRSLTYLATSTAILSPQSFSELPPSLHTLRCYGGELHGRDAVNFPPSVQRLEICSTKLVDWDYLLKGRKIETVTVTLKTGYN